MVIRNTQHPLFISWLHICWRTAHSPNRMYGPEGMEWDEDEDENKMGQKKACASQGTTTERLQQAHYSTSWFYCLYRTAEFRLVKALGQSQYRFGSLCLNWQNIQGIPMQLLKCPAHWSIFICSLNRTQVVLLGFVPLPLDIGQYCGFSNFGAGVLNRVWWLMPAQTMGEQVFHSPAPCPSGRRAPRGNTWMMQSRKAGYCFWVGACWGAKRCNTYLAVFQTGTKCQTCLAVCAHC